MIVLTLLLVLAGFAYALLRQRVRLQRGALGLGATRITAADDSRLGSPTLRSKRYGLIGRPDHLLRSGQQVIPVEQKPSAKNLHDSHVLQIAAQCLLVQDVYGVRPPYGIVMLAGGRQQQIAFTPLLESRLLATMYEMRTYLVTNRQPGRRWVEHKCLA